MALAWAGLRWFERINIFIPSRQFSGVIPSAFGIKEEEVFLRAQDGPLLHAWFLPAAPFRTNPLDTPVVGPLAGRTLTLLYCHGNAGNISDRLFKANLFHRLGLNVLLFDYRGYGRSQGTPSEQGTYKDAEAAWRFLTEKKKIPADRLVIYGESLGNGVALETALRHPPQALILDSAFTSVIDMGLEIFPYLPVRWLVRFRYDNLSKIPKIRCPVLVMHSAEDAVVPFRMGRRLFEAAPQPKEFFQMKGTHDEGYIDAGPAYPRAIQAFLERALRTIRKNL